MLQPAPASWDVAWGNGVPASTSLKDPQKLSLAKGMDGRMDTFQGRAGFPGQGKQALDLPAKGRQQSTVLPLKDPEQVRRGHRQVTGDWPVPTQAHQKAKPHAEPVPVLK